MQNAGPEKGPVKRIRKMRVLLKVGRRRIPGRQGLGGWVKLPVEAPRRPTCRNMEGQSGGRMFPIGHFWGGRPINGM